MRASRKKNYSPPSMELITYDQARSKILAEERPALFTDRLSLLALYLVLVFLPLLVLLSALDPSAFLINHVLAAPSPLLWIAWGFACFWAGLSCQDLLKKLGRQSRLRSSTQSFLFLLGVVNCVTVVALLWLVGKAG
jgi:hypothetical protein